MRFQHLLVTCVLGAAATACSSPPKAGSSCDPSNANSCGTDLVCQENVCKIPLGSTCDLMADPSYCASNGNCVAVMEASADGGTTTVGRCYLPEGATCDPAMQNQCDPSLTCAQHQDGTYACRKPVIFRGRVLKSTDGMPIAGALVIGLDAQPVAVTDVATSGSDGAYELRVPAVRDSTGAPVAANYTLRASADGFQTFPSGIRTAIPISTTLAVSMSEGYVVSGTLTDVVLIPVQDPAAARVSISGHVVAQGHAAGVLVVATGSAKGYSAITDVNGAYTIFNVPPGMYEVRGYASGLQLNPASVTAASTNLTGVDLTTSSSALSTVTGTMQIVNPGSCSATSVVLAVESTFDEAIGRGELPPGLRAPAPPAAPSIGNGQTWTIANVPDGRYVVLAGFENDGCVRDPDTSIAGTAIVHLALPADAGTLSQSFKVTGALATYGPGMTDPESVTAPPTLRWEDDSGEADYLVEVFDAYGNLAWTHTEPGVSGSSMVSVPYAGPLMSGMYYQFRATSRDNRGTPLSRTEDLRGVFFVP